MPYAAHTLASICVAAALGLGCSSGGAGTEAADAPNVDAATAADPFTAIESPTPAATEPVSSPFARSEPTAQVRPSGSSDTGSRYIETGADPLGRLAVETSPIAPFGPDARPASAPNATVPTAPAPGGGFPAPTGSER